jgi:hypothetical protein
VVAVEVRRARSVAPFGRERLSGGQNSGKFVIGKRERLAALHAGSSVSRQVTGRANRTYAPLRQADLAHHLEQAIGVGVEKPLELRPVHVGDLAARFHETLDHGRVLHERANRVAQDARYV